MKTFSHIANGWADLHNHFEELAEITAEELRVECDNLHNRTCRDIMREELELAYPLA